MTEYSLRDVVRLAGLSRRIVLRLVKAGIVAPAQIDATEHRFGFRDLVVLRTARRLYASNIPSRRILSSLRKLQATLPQSFPLSGLCVFVVAGDVVVRDRGATWEARSGQMLLDLDARQDGESVVVERAGAALSDAARHFELACSLEDDAPDDACKAYRQAIECDASFVHAYINLGCLLHALRRWGEAEAVYRDGLAQAAERSVLLFNLGVLQEDRGEAAAALETYRAALAADATLADAYFNLARLYAALGRSRDALRAYNDYRRFAGADTS